MADKNTPTETTESTEEKKTSRFKNFVSTHKNTITAAAIGLGVGVGVTAVAVRNGDSDSTETGPFEGEFNSTTETTQVTEA